jgi:NAD(P)H-hydrate epimerase
MEHTHLLAVDVPSGLDATTGEAHQPAVRAAATCTLTAMKRGLWTATGRAHAGVITVADIGMPVAAWRHAGLAAPHAVRGGELLELG